MTQTDIQPLEILRSLGFNGTPVATPLQGGFDMAMWKVESEDQIYALRVFRPGAHKGCEHERVVMATARAAGLPVPEVHAAGVWQDRPALLITWLAGRTLADELLARPWHVWRLGIEFGRVQAAIHAVSAPDLLRQQPGAWIAWQCEGEQTLQDHLRHFPTDKTALLHLDYHPRNVLTDGEQITGIIDWTNAHAGDPRADAARTISILRLDPLVRKPLILWLGLRVFEMAWRVGYQREHGHLTDMPLFYSWAGTVIQHNLAHRYKHAPQELAPARRWTNKWRARARC
ncbi:MAG: phosphotransferase [Ktedonobacteraceae bacterium]|nr:phosphotransferase [Ktedonobacteraceae bacterium]